MTSPRLAAWPSARPDNHIERLDPTRLLVQVGRQVLPVGRLYLPELISRLRTVG